MWHSNLVVAIVQLALVQDRREVAASHRAFVRDMVADQALAIDLIRRTQYWVYEPVSKTFSPSKFSGYVGMDFPRYDAARRGRTAGVKFDGGITQQAITAVLGDYQPDPELGTQLERWAESTFGRDVLDGIDANKWRFTRLPVSGSGGLAAIAGGWEGSEELVEAVADVREPRRASSRPAPEID